MVEARPRVGGAAQAVLVAKKDLRIEARSRVAINQVVPFALLVLVLFGFALDADTAALRNFAPGLFWLAVLLAAVLAVHRSVSVESGDGVGDALLLAGLRPDAVFVGKTLALGGQLLALAVVLLGGIVVLYGASIEDAGLLVITLIAAVIGIASTGTVYGALLAGQQARETVLPMLLLPVLSPVLIAATRAWGDAMGTVATDGWAWLALLAGFAAIYSLVGAMSYGTLLEAAHV